MKKLLTIALSVLPLICTAQNFTGLTLQEAQKKAQSEKKIILVDVMNIKQQNDTKTKQEKEVYALPGVAEFADKHIVSIRIDMGTEAGKEFAPLLQMNMYPTYAFLMPNGDLLNIVSPYFIGKTPSLFLEKAKEAYDKANEKWKNSRNITFEDATFEQALEMAAKENKLIFIDAYTESCQPCMKMVKDVFSQDKVADYFNANFINLTINLGIVRTDLAKKYNTSGYPTYLFVNSKGDLVYTANGFMEADKFMEHGKAALSKNGIQFTHGTWSEILELAKKENKPIFVDCFTVWCGPCKMMSSTVFMEQTVADYFNSTFINAKIDMEKGEGIDIKNKYEVKAYPTFLYLDKNGKELNRLVGSMPAAEFIAESKLGMSGNGLTKMQAKYAAGDRTPAFVLEYLAVLDKAYLQKDAQVVGTEFFKSLKPADYPLLKTKPYWTLFVKHVNDYSSDVFKYVYANKADFYTLFPQDMVDRKFLDVWTAGSQSFVTKEGDVVKFDVKGFNEYAKLMKKEGVKGWEEIVINAKISNAEQQKDWNEFVTLVDAKIKSKTLENIPAYELFNWGMRIDKNCTDKKYRNQAAEWFAKMIPIFAENEARRNEEAKKAGAMLAMSMINYGKEFQRLYDSLSAK
ncbi:MAG: hypothetical protein A2X18_01680 [Bacteroidetes bacterium GWF2_40_14]|nr:MAG: hypothetical protein A2X18_01680 [Bacteroidetes bacterium GWF2_40_14]